MDATTEAADRPSIQDHYIPSGVCFGCGPANRQGLGLQSFSEGERAVARWMPQEHHGAFPGVLNGGIVGVLIDCHSGAGLALAYQRQEGLWPNSESPRWATASFEVRLLRPTPMDEPVELWAWAAHLEVPKAEIEVELHSAGKLRAEGTARWTQLRPR